MSLESSEAPLWTLSWSRVLCTPRLKEGAELAEHDGWACSRTLNWRTLRFVANVLRTVRSARRGSDHAATAERFSRRPKGGGSGRGRDRRRCRRTGSGRGGGDGGAGGGGACTPDECWNLLSFAANSTLTPSHIPLNPHRPLAPWLPGRSAGAGGRAGVPMNQHLNQLGRSVPAGAVVSLG